MVRKRKQQPKGLQKYSRYLMSGVAAAGLLLSVGCVAKGDTPLNSSAYVQLGIVSLPILGALAYFLIMLLALGPVIKKNKALEGPTWLGLFVGSTAMTVFSSYLLYVMFAVVGEPCVPCMISAILSFGLWVLTLADNHRKTVGQLLLPGVAVLMIAFTTTAGLYAYAQNPSSFTAGNPTPAVTTDSGTSEIALAKHLTSIGAKKYGAWWCPHCHAQQTLFGKQAFKDLTYVECDEEGVDPQPGICRAVGVESYPTWEVNGELYPGVKSLQTLAELSGYSGPNSFTNEMPPR
ncbi:MAG: vitamin K epoxide reductase family protein [Cyanobacteria bacterium P01_A01_bin.116]